MTKKSERVQELLQKVQPRWTPPTPLAEGGLVEQGLLAVLRRHLSQKDAEAALGRLQKAFEDWNECRVSQVQEVVAVMGGRADRTVASDVKTYLQEVFQQTHGLDLEFLHEDPVNAGKVVQSLEFLGLSTGAWLLSLAGPEDVPVHTPLVRVLDRFGLMTRTASQKKARSQIEPLIPKGRTVEFLTKVGEVADRWCDARKPLCHECVLVESCVYGKKAYKEWQAQQVRLEAQRAKEEARRLAAEKKEEQRRLREAERQRKKLEAEAKKAERERQRQRKAAEREAEKAARKKAREEQAAKRAKERGAAAKKKKAKKTAKKSTAKRKTTSRKATGGSKAKKKTKAKARARRTTKKPAAAKKTTKRPKTSRSGAKKAGTKKKAAKKKAKTTRRRSAARR